MKHQIVLTEDEVKEAVANYVTARSKGPVYVTKEAVSFKDEDLKYTVDVNAVIDVTP